MKIRKITEEDLKERVEWMNNPAVYRTMHFIPPISLEKTVEWHKKNLTNNSRCDLVFENDKGELLAMGGLTNIDYGVRKAEFYIFVNPEKQRQGIGSRATAMLCRYGFDVLQLHKIYLYTNASNAGARKTYEKVGFVLEGRHRNEMVVNEHYEDRLYYGLLASDFQNNSEPLGFSGWKTPIIEDVKLEDRQIKMVRDDLYPECGGV